jgi:hypothetical protein
MEVIIQVTLPCYSLFTGVLVGLPFERINVKSYVTKKTNGFSFVVLDINNY